MATPIVISLALWIICIVGMAHSYKKEKLIGLKWWGIGIGVGIAISLLLFLAYYSYTSGLFFMFTIVGTPGVSLYYGTDWPNNLQAVCLLSILGIAYYSIMLKAVTTLRGHGRVAIAAIFLLPMIYNLYLWTGFVTSFR